MSDAVGYALFPTALGACGLAWSLEAVVGALLPEADEAALRGRFSRRHPKAIEAEPRGFAAAAILGVQRLLAGEAVDLTDTPLDFGAAPDLHRRIYAVVRAIPPGRTLTYGEVARAVGEPRGAQAVGQAMGRNPIPILMPCHRVVAADGRLGGFTAPGGVATKRRILDLEGVTSTDSLPLFSNRN